MEKRSETVDPLLEWAQTVVNPFLTGVQSGLCKKILGGDIFVLTLVAADGILHTMGSRKKPEKQVRNSAPRWGAVVGKSEFCRDFTRRLLSFKGADESTVAFCVRIGIAERTLRRWKKGEKLPHVDTVWGIANTLGCPVDWLLFGPGQRPVGEDLL